MKKLKKETIKVEILMEEGDSTEGMSLHQIEHECLEGGWSYAWEAVDSEIIEGEEACENACLAQGTDLSFFFPE